MLLQRSSEYVDENGERKSVTGSLEHYFHFLLGYLLPAVFYSLNSQDKKLWLEDCGPLMTPILEDVFSALKQNFTIGGCPPDNVESHVLDDWAHRIVNRKPLWVAVEHLRRIAQEKKDCCEIPETGPQHLLLRRADTPDFFKRGGGAQIEGYGVSRRSVRNIEFLTWGLRIVRPGVSVYCAGEHSFWCQIRTFSSARAISGMWGAEWANVCWAAENLGKLRLRILYPGTGNLLGAFLDSIGANYSLVRVRDHFARDSLLRLAAFFASEHEP